MGLIHVLALKEDLLSQRTFLKGGVQYMYVA